MAVDKQITYDIIIAGLRKQNAKSLNKNGNCAFRGLNNTRCAVGFLIDDKEYRPAFDDPKKDDPGFTFVRNKGHDESLLSSLMLVHDHSEPKSWEKQFKDIASQFNLIYRAPQNV